eukprot:5067749-Amphidinium_carterae.1
MLTFDPERRISAESALRDAWMSTKVPKVLKLFFKVHMLTPLQQATILPGNAPQISDMSLMRCSQARQLCCQVISIQVLNCHAARVAKTAQTSTLPLVWTVQAKNKLVKTALRMIAWRLSDTEMKSLRETFVAFDTNGDGILTIAELKECVHEWTCMCFSSSTIVVAWCQTVFEVYE